MDAAEAFANSNLSLDEVSLAFLAGSLLNPLLKYLERRLSKFSNNDKVQSILLSSWLLELKLSNMRLLGSVANSDSLSDILELLKRLKDKLHHPTVYSILQVHGCENFILEFAEIIHDWPQVVRIHYNRREYLKVLAYIERQSSFEMVYEYSPKLIGHVANDLIALWMRCSADLTFSSRLIIPSMLKYERMHAKGGMVTFKIIQGIIITFLVYIIQRGSTDSQMHNYLFFLYCKEKSISKIESFLNSQVYRHV